MDEAGTPQGNAAADVQQEPRVMYHSAMVQLRERF